MMDYLTKRQQRMIMYLYANKTLTRKEQDFWVSVFFYSQVKRLQDVHVIKKLWKDGRLEYSLTPKGKKLAIVLKDIIGKFEIEEDQI